MSHIVQRFRGGTDRDRGGYSSVESIASRGTSYDSQLSPNDSLDGGMAGTSETLPCGVDRMATGARETLELDGGDKTIQWTLGNWAGSSSTGQQHQPVVSRSGQQNPVNSTVLSFTNNGNANSNNTVRVDLASPEDISLDTDSSRAVYGNATGTFGTTV